MGELDRRLFFSHFRRKDATDLSAQYRKERAQSADSVTAENRDHLETLQRQLSPLGFDDFFVKLREDMTTISENIPLDELLELDTWRVNLLTPGAGFDENTALRALTGYVIQVKRLHTNTSDKPINIRLSEIRNQKNKTQDDGLLVSEVGPFRDSGELGHTQNTATFYAFIFQPVSDVSETTQGLEYGSASPRIYIGMDPDGISGRPNLSRILGVDNAMETDKYLELVQGRDDLVENTYWAAAMDFGHNPPPTPEPIILPKIVTIDERTYIGHDPSYEERAMRDTILHLNDLFFAQPIIAGRKRFRRPRFYKNPPKTVEKGIFREASEVFIPDQAGLYTEQLADRFLAFLQLHPDFAVYEADARKIDELK